MSKFDPIDADGWTRRARRVPSLNHDRRPEATPVDLLVIHHISLPAGQFSGDAIEQLFTNRLDTASNPAFLSLAGVRVSAHFLIRRRGELIQFVSGDDRAWHAGQSCFQGRERCNDFSIGIELEGTGDRPFTQAQYRVLASLTTTLAKRWPLRFVVGHSDIAPGRKHDPGPTFDWTRYLETTKPCGLERIFDSPDRAKP